MITDGKIKELVDELLEIDEKCAKAGHEWAQANQIAERYEELKKPLLKQIMCELRELPVHKKTAHNNLEEIAMSDARYVEWVEDKVVHQRRANDLKIEQSKYHNRQKTLITVISLGKSLMNIR